MQPHPANVLRTALALVLALFALSRTDLKAAPPANDLCASAILVPNTFPYLSPLIDVTDATTVGDPPFPPPSTFFDTNVSRSVWFRFVPNATANYALSVAADTATTIEDTSMAIYTSASPCGPMNLLTYNEDSGLLRSAIYTSLTNNRDYYIVVWVGAVESATNNLLLQLRVSKPTVPTNDTCAGAEVIPGNATFPYNTLQTDTTMATDDPGVFPGCAPSDPDRVPSRDVWYKFTPAVSDAYIFSTRESGTTVEDTLLALYSGNCPGPFTELSCNDNSIARGVIARALTGGTTYYLAAWDNSPEFITGETLMQIRVSRAAAPTIVTLPPSSIASTGAVLNGTVNANALQTRFWFEWGPTSGLGTTSQVKVILANSTTTLDTNIAINGFTPNTTYRYRFVATNTAGMSRGDERTFAWSNTPPRMVSPLQVGNSVSFEFDGNSNQVYLIQDSTSLSATLPTWQTLGRATNTSNPSHFHYTHRSAVDPNRFFRIWAP